MAFAEDLSVFFDTVTGFAEAVTFDGTPDVPMIFDAAFFQDSLGVISVESAQPAALAMVASVGSAPHGKAIARGGVSYIVKNTHPDGTGLVLLILEKQ
jgi:hypothetical protein